MGEGRGGGGGERKEKWGKEGEGGEGRERGESWPLSTHRWPTE